MYMYVQLYTYLTHASQTKTGMYIFLIAHITSARGILRQLPWTYANPMAHRLRQHPKILRQLQFPTAHRSSKMYFSYLVFQTITLPMRFCIPKTIEFDQKILRNWSETWLLQRHTAFTSKSILSGW